MVYVISSFQMAPGMRQEAREILHRQGEYMRKTFGTEFVRLEPVTPGAGEADKILSIGTFDSLAAWGEHLQKSMTDPQRNALMHEAFREKRIFLLEGFTRTVYTTM
jgi:hypothetical protein